jgi:hypothetical protein
VSGESGDISADPLLPLGISVVGGRRKHLTKDQPRPGWPLLNEIPSSTTFFVMARGVCRTFEWLLKDGKIFGVF